MRKWLLIERLLTEPDESGQPKRGNLLVSVSEQR